MPPFAPAATVAAPGRTPLPFGAFSVLSFRENADRWINGVQWETLTCGPAGVISAPDCDIALVDGIPRQTPKNAGPLATGDAFSVYGWYTCNPIGHSAEYAGDQARAHLAIREEGAVETAVEAIIRAKGAVLSGLTVPFEIVSALEQHFAEQYGSQGVIWVSRRMASMLFDKGPLKISGGRLITPLGTPVVAAVGISDDFIGIAAPPVAYRSEIHDYENADDSPYTFFDRGQNNLTALAERDFLLAMEECGMTYAISELTDYTITQPTPTAE